MLASKIDLTSSFFSCTSLEMTEFVRLLRLSGPRFSEAAAADGVPALATPAVAPSESPEARLAVCIKFLSEVLALILLTAEGR